MVGADADRRTKVLLPDILFSNTGVPMVADFGQARALDPNGIVTKLPPIYNYGIPPEIFTQKSATFESDIYQVGLTLYRAVNGVGLTHRTSVLYEIWVFQPLFAIFSTQQSRYASKSGLCSSA